MGIKKIVSAFDISAMGMKVQRKKMDAIASNLANVETTRTQSGEPYRRKVLNIEGGKNFQTFRQMLSKAGSKLRQTDSRHMSRGKSVEILGKAGVPVEAEVVDVQGNAFRSEYNPDHPDADAEGYVRVPNINLVTEMVDMIVASRTYEANATALDANKNMSKKALEI